MLNQDTKRKIDTARQILVGKVPDPKAQVEQITTALIYKFMDDMDKEAQELGGKSSFFTKGYEKYAWTKLIDQKLSGQDRLNLYVEAINTLSQNPYLPQLFRDIFKDAFLPYRDPATLNLFLKKINGFTYDHSEDLGDAFEYLLSILGSQGEAGQFRTPRHIIDFIVSIIDPQKGETILDPACGTAGFLISSYKHILRQNHNKPLTPDEKKKLMENLVGYDISPDMVRLSLVNMYLHDFSEPKIYEYDTLTSEDKWEETFNMIMTNPPFMTPKGGIRPHKRFSVRANRSEVLFVDYILEHLRNGGRAGIIVPEGIIFKSDAAYKALRKLLLEDGLLAVISLPAGVFNPYSGVKTSILIFDGMLSKRTKEILFLKIQNDGFDLGAQRREIEKNDLPSALEIIKKYKNAIKCGEDFKINEDETHIAHLVSKDKIADSCDYNLTGDRYNEIENFANAKWPIIELEEVCKIEKGTSITKAIITEGDIPVIAGGQQPAYYHNKNNREGQTITISASGAYAGFVNFFNTPIFASDCTTIKSNNESKILTKFIFLYLKGKQREIYKLQKGVGQPHVYGKDLAKIKIPLPPLKVQKEIVEQIEVKQKAIEAAKAVIENLEKERRYFGQSLGKMKNVERVELGEVCTFEYGKALKEINRKGGEYPVYGSNGIIGFHNEHIVEGPFIIIGRKGTAGAVVYSEKSGFPIDTTFYVRLRDQKLDSIYLKFLYLLMQTLNLGKVNTQSSVPGLNRNDAYKIEIPFPSIEIQKQLVSEMEEYERIIEINKKLIVIMEQKIADVLNEI